jgi:hypothetical protein
MCRKFVESLLFLLANVNTWNCLILTPKFVVIVHITKRPNK